MRALTALLLIVGLADAPGVRINIEMAGGATSADSAALVGALTRGLEKENRALVLAPPEMPIASGGQVTRATAERIVRIKPARFFVIGRLVRTTSDSCAFDLRLVNVETGEARQKFVASGLRDSLPTIAESIGVSFGQTIQAPR